MSLATLRTAFVDETGRTDLTKDQVIQFVNDGVRLLDRLTHFEKSDARAFIPVSSGDRKVTFSSDCRVIEKVWLVDKDDGRTEIVKSSYAELLAYYGNVEDVDPGTPEYYSPLVIRAHPESFDPSGAPFNEYSGYIDTEQSYHDIRGITFLPPVDGDYLIEVMGKFYSPSLSDTLADNWWSFNHHRAVVDAAKYVLESTYRNTEGMKDYMAALAPTITGIDYDLAEEEASDATRMEG